MEGKNSAVNMEFQPAVTKRASEVIYEQIRDRIIRHELKPGDRLPAERSLMEMFQRSRPTIREALRMLERNGYIRTIPGSSGAVVQAADESGIEQVMDDAIQGGLISLAETGEYRLVCEVAAARWAAQRRTDQDIEEMRELLRRMKDAVNKIDVFIDLDPVFHKLVAKAANNKVAMMMNKTLAQINEGFMREKMASMTVAARNRMCQRVYAQHSAIFEAIAAGDAEAAARAMEEHMRAFQLDLQPDV